MSEWKAKRFWKKAEVTETDGGHTVTLDGRPVKTPAKALLVLPTRAMAEAVAAEWQAQEKDIDPLSMPVTRGANAAIDKVSVQRAAVVAMLAEYGDSDLLCYRAAGPEELIAQQAEGWDAPLAWAADRFAATLRTGQGVMHVLQDADALAALRAALDAHDDFEIAAMHDLVSISGSLVLALAVSEGHLSPAEAWRLSRIDEDWQISQWGEDEEAMEAAAKKREAFEAAARFLDLARAR